MIISELSIAHFGKLQDKQISLRPGMNVITGDNESGKTTITRFIQAMLYGMAPESELYKRYYPYDFHGVYGGSLRVLYEGAFYMITRDFLSGTVLVMKCSDESVVGEPERWMEKFLAGMTEAGFTENAVLSQESFIKDRERFGESEEKNKKRLHEAAIRNKLRKAKDILLYMQNEEESKIDMTLETRYADIVRERREVENDLATLKTGLEEKTAELKEEQEELERDVARVNQINEDKLQKLKEAMLRKKEEIRSYPENLQKRAERSPFLSILLLVIGALSGIGGAFSMLSQKRTFANFYESKKLLVLFGAFLLFFLAGLISSIVLIVKRKKAKKLLSEKARVSSEADAAERDYQDYLDHKEEREEKVENYEERKNGIQNLRSQLTFLQDSITEKNLQFQRKKDDEALLLTEHEKNEKVLSEIESIKLAVSAVSDGGAERVSDIPDALSDRAGKYLSMIDKCKDESIVMEDGVLLIMTGGTEKPLSAFSTVRIQEILLATRLATLDEIDPGKMFPLLLDDIFTNFDAERLRAGMELLRSLGRQVVLLSCQTRERKAL